MQPSRIVLLALSTGVLTAGVVASCSATAPGRTFGSGGGGGEGPTSGPGAPGTSGSGEGGDIFGVGGGPISSCSPSCGPTETCVDGQCLSGCAAAEKTQSSVGCEYYAVAMDAIKGGGPTGAPFNGCFVAFVANTSAGPAHIDASFNGASIDLGQFAKIPSGSGKALAYGAYDPGAGLAPGQVAILFLHSGPGGVPCPVPAALTSGVQISGTGYTSAFRIQSDVPVVAYQMLPYGGGSAAATGASLLLPTSSWDTNYIAANAYKASFISSTSPSLNIVAAEDATSITLLPKAAISGGGGVQPATAGQPVTYTLSAGQVLQITQQAELTGSPVQATKRIGLFAGHVCLNVPADVVACDHAEQQIPPIKALGHEYVAVSYRQRSSKPENPLWRIVGVVDGTSLTYEPDVGGPVTVALGEVVELSTATPFTVKSQDAAHPFLLMTYMSGWGAVDPDYGDADAVRVSPSDQYLKRYVFFTDPTYPETNLVVIRKRGPSGFAEVSLDCAGNLTGFTPVGTAGEYEWTRTDLVRHNFEPQGACDNGRHEMSSAEPFGLWVWGWGSSETPGVFTAAVSYGYPAGEGVVPINNVVVLPEPK